MTLVSWKRLRDKGNFALLSALIFTILVPACNLTYTTAMEAFNLAEREIKLKYEGAYVFKLYVGQIPRLIKGELGGKVVDGKAREWDFEYYYPEEHLWMQVGATADKANIWHSSASFFDEGEVPEQLLPTLDDWKLDSPAAFQIAKQIAEENEKGDLVPIMMSLSRPSLPKNDLEWETVFFPKHIGTKTIAFSVTINARTGEVIEIDQPEYKYQ